MTTPDIKLANHASESGHWYNQQGDQIEGVPYAASNKAKAGQLRAPTIRDARANNWGPGVTTIIGCAAAPGLTKWLIRQHVLAALTLDRQPEETDDAYLARIEADAREHGKQAAEEGTRIHAAIQAHVQGQPVPDAYVPHVAGAMDALSVIGPDQRWDAEVSGAHPFGYGTRADMCGTVDGQKWLIDWKGKDGDLESLMAEKLWDNHHQQLAATRRVLAARHDMSWLDARCAIGFVSRTHPGAAYIIEASEDDLGRGWHCFASLLDYWQAKNDYRPNWR